MSLSTSNSSPVQHVRRGRLASLYLLTAALVCLALGSAELAVRAYSAAQAHVGVSVDTLIRELPKRAISGREIGNQMLVHNAALFAQYPDPASISIGYVGTSRSKVLRPRHFGIPSAVVGAGNSYNEITYGLLLQAELLRRRFPGLKRMYVEASMLLRRPARLIVEEDHRQYLPLLKAMEPLCDMLGANAPCKNVFAATGSAMAENEQTFKWELLERRRELRFTNLIRSREAEIPVLSDSLFATLQPNGERTRLPLPARRNEPRVMEVGNDHVKVQRLRDIRSNAPWDGLFDLFAIWGRENGVQIVLFQPPVRSDLRRFQLQYGLQEHVADLERISKQYGIPFIDLNLPELGYTEDWSLFSDEDHMETCIGTGVLTLAVSGSLSGAELGPSIEALTERAIEAGYQRELKVCHSRAGYVSASP